MCERSFSFQSPVWGFCPVSKSGGGGVGNATTGSKLQKCEQTLQHPERAISLLRLWLVRGATRRVSSLVLGEWGWHSFASVSDSPHGGVRSAVYTCTAALSVQLEFGFCSALWRQLQRSLQKHLPCGWVPVFAYCPAPQFSRFDFTKWVLAGFNTLKKKNTCFMYPVVWASVK